MGSSLNRVQIIGHLGKDPEVRRTGSGSAVVSFSVAVSETWRDKASGERKEKTEWVPITIWNEGLGKVAEQYLKKGSKVFIEGKFQTRKWQDQSGADKYSTEVVLNGFDGNLIMLGDAGGGGQREGRASDDQRGRTMPRGTGMSREQAMGGSYSPVDDDIPFNVPWM